MLFGNTVNRVMLDPPVWEHSLGLSAVAQRKTWLALPGDAVVTAQPIPISFCDYVASVTETPSASVHFVSPQCVCTTPLPEVAGLGAPLAAYASQNQPEFCPYALDEGSLKFAEDLRMPVAGYSSNPPPHRVSKFTDWNRKSSFRQLAAELGLPVVSGRSCQGLPEVQDAVRELGASHGQALIKLDRSSNGFGSLPVTRPSISIESLETHFARFRAHGDRFVVEAFMDFTEAPSVEAFVDEVGVHIAYLCNQLCAGPSFRGIVAPPPGLSASIRQELLRAAETFGGFLWQAGYRGYFDLDAGVTRDGELFFTEANVRRTAGTALHELVTRIVGPNYQADRMWLADTQPALHAWELADAIKTIQAKGLAYSHAKTRGVLLPAFTLPQDSKWRYLILAEEVAELREYERRLSEILGFATQKEDTVTELEASAW